MTRKQLITKCKRMHFDVKEGAEMSQPVGYPDYYENNDVVLDEYIRISCPEYERMISFVGPNMIIMTVEDALQLIKDSRQLSKLTQKAKKVCPKKPT